METSELLSRNLSLFQVGSMISIEIATPAGKKCKFRTCFIGYFPKNYILIQYPDNSKVNAFSQYIVPGLSVTVRGLVEGSEGAVVAFVSNVRQTLQVPSKLIVLEFPYKVLVQSLRSNIRIDTDFDAKIGVNKEFYQSVLSDLSITGCQVLVHNALSLMMADEKEVEITVENVTEAENIKLIGEIRNTKKQGDDVSLGVYFSNEVKDQVLKLIEYAVTEVTKV